MGMCVCACVHAYVYCVFIMYIHKSIIFDCVGERVDFILNANQTLGYYWIHVRGLGECAEREIYQLAILAYKGSSESSLSLYPGYFFGTSRNNVSTVHRNVYKLKVREKINEIKMSILIFIPKTHLENLDVFPNGAYLSWRLNLFR